MDPEHKKYILEHFDTMSVKELAGTLGIKERKVRKFLASADPGKKSMSARKHAKKLPDNALSGVLSSKTRYSQLSSFFIFIALFSVAFIVRLIYLDQIKNSPFFVPFYRGLDDYLYDSWAQAIAQGDILGKEVFYGLPLYPYFLGLIYFLFGHTVFVAKAIQGLIGALSCGLIYLIGQKVFNRVIGVSASIMFAFYAMDIFFEGFFVSSFLAIFLNCLLILSLLSLQTGFRWIKVLASGVLIGLSSLANSSILLFVPFIVFWFFSVFKHRPKQKIYLSSFLLILTAALTIAPVTVRNYVVGKDLVPITAHAGITFYAGNNPSSSGSFHLPREIGTSVLDTKKNSKIIAERASKRTLNPSEISGFWFAEGVSFIRKNPTRYLQLAGKKFLLFWNANEIPDILPVSFFKQYAPLLTLPLFSFAFIAPFSLFGIFLCIRSKNQNLNLLFYYVLCILISTLIYFVNSRYRLLAVPALVLFASLSLYWFFVKLVKRDFAPLLFAALGVAAISLFSQIKILEFRPAQAYNNLGITLKQQGLFAEAISAYKKAIDSDPNYDSAFFNLGLLYLEQKDYNNAIKNFNRALQINPNLAKAHKRLGLAYSRLGDNRAAVSHWKTSLKLDPYQEDLRALLDRYGS